MEDDEPFKSVIAGDREAMANFTMKDLEKIVFVTHTGMTTGETSAIAKDWNRSFSFDKLP
ncbi:MAG TPA: hypothetical protein VJX69_09885 [Terriglobales bacterium]|nr:hypothetical protein [Terriglobales bacterium]